MTIFEGFRDLDEVLDSYGIHEGELPKGYKLIFAGYDTGDYEGYSFVLYLHEGLIYAVMASHCSCYGLEGQWAPQRETVSTVMKYLAGSHFSEYASQIREKLFDGLTDLG